MHIVILADITGKEEFVAKTCPYQSQKPSECGFSNFVKLKQRLNAKSIGVFKVRPIAKKMTRSSLTQPF